MHKIDGDGATTDNRFTEGNPATGVVATTVTSDWLNAVQAEIINVLAAAGIEPAKTDNSQLLQAIISLISGGGVAVTATGVSIADAGDFFAGSDVEAALQQLAQKIYSGTFGSEQITRSVFTESGSAIAMKAWHKESIVELANPSAIAYTVPLDSTLSMPIGTSIQVAQIGAGKVEFFGEAGVTLQYPSQFEKATIGQYATAVLYKVAPNTWRLGGMLGAAA